MISPRSFAKRCGTALCVVFLFVAQAAEAGNVTVPGVSSGSFNVKVTSIKESHFLTTIRQQYDFSCGSAALATLLTYHYEDPVVEQQVFQEMYDRGDKAKINKEGFSLLDIQQYLQRNGYKADGFRIPLDKLREIGVPAIVLINHNGYKHFVVIKGVTDKDVLLGDPTSGIRVLTRPEFEPMWNGLAFLVRNRKNIGARHFNLAQEWHVKEKAPLAAASTIGQPLNLVTLHLAGKLGL